MYKTFYGVCPTQGKQYSVSVNYVDASSFEEKVYVKGHGICNFVKQGGNCTASKCPIIASAPEEL